MIRFWPVKRTGIALHQQHPDTKFLIERSKFCNSLNILFVSLFIELMHFSYPI